MLDITTITTAKIPQSISVLQESINSLKIANETLSVKNDTLQKLLIVSLIIIPLLGFVIYKKQLTNYQNKKQQI
jgi:hypothetical protein